MTELLNKLSVWIRGGFLVVVGGAIGWFGNQYMDARSAYKEALTENYASFNEAAAGLEESLKEFASIAAGKKSKTGEATDQLQSRLLGVLRVAHDLNRRLGDDKQVMEHFESATVALKRAADSVSGPLDGKVMIQAVADYLVAEGELRDAVVNEHNAVLSRKLM